MQRAIIKLWITGIIIGISQSERTLLKIYVIKYQVCALRLRCIVVASFFNMAVKSDRNRQILTEHSVKVRSFLFPFTIGKCNSIYSECVKVYLVRI